MAFSHTNPQGKRQSPTHIKVLVNLCRVIPCAHPLGRKQKWRRVEMCLL